MPPASNSIWLSYQPLFGVEEPSSFTIGPLPPPGVALNQVEIETEVLVVPSGPVPELPDKAGVTK